MCSRTSQGVRREKTGNCPWYSKEEISAKIAGNKEVEQLRTSRTELSADFSCNSAEQRKVQLYCANVQKIQKLQNIGESTSISTSYMHYVENA